MAESSPLLPRYNPNPPIKAAPSSVEDAIEISTGSTGIAQLLQALYISLSLIFDSQQTFINVFTDAEPTWHCTNAADPVCSSAPTPCALPTRSWAWDHPEHTSVISEWGLECSGPAIVGLPASAFFAGCLAGGLLLATLADSLMGRKNMLFLSCFAMSLSGSLTVFSPNVLAYAAFRFISGVARATLCTSALVLSTEIVGKRWRDKTSIICFFCFTLGFLSLPAMAYVGRGSSWKTLYLWTSIPAFFYSIIGYFLVQESPRWLLVRGRREEAIQTLKKMAFLNGNSALVTCSFSSLAAIEENCGNSDVFSALKILLEKSWALKRLTAVMMAAFGIGLVYYGMPLNVGNLGSNLYLSVTFNALAELPSSVVTFFLVGMLNRRSSSLVLTTLSGICSILCVFAGTEGGVLRIAAEVMSFFFACTACNLILIYSIELFPTCVRNSAISMVRQAIVFGGVFAPVLIAAGRKRSYLSFGVFGVVIGCCGLFVACLPETRGRNISDTMEEEEYKESLR